MQFDEFDNKIREAADQLLPPKVCDVDGIEDDRTGAQSVFEGPAPNIEVCADEADENIPQRRARPGAGLRGRLYYSPLTFAPVLRLG